MLKKIIDSVEQMGGKCLIVGGYVRDKIMGYNPKDMDIEVYGLSYDVLEHVLKQFGDVSLVGKSFGIVKLRCNGEEFDFSVPRKENKCGVGHKDFTVEVDENMSCYEASLRRDFTINSMYMSFDGEIIDPHNGQEDIQNRVLKPTSEAFKEDSLRILRGFQFAGRFDMTASDSFIEMANDCKNELDELPVERLWVEFSKWAEKSIKPSSGLKVLEQTCLDKFPHLDAMNKTEQEFQWHPEGNVWEHTKYVCDAMNDICDRENIQGEQRIVLLLAALCHDIGKPDTTIIKDGQIRSPGHAFIGGPITNKFLTSIGCPPGIIEQVIPLVVEHMVHIGIEWTNTNIKRLALRMKKSNIQMLGHIMEADYSGRPPLPKGIPDKVKQMVDIAKVLNIQEKPPEMIVKGKHVLDFGISPGPEVGRLIKLMFEKQLNGEFSTLEQGLEIVRDIL